MNCEVGALVIEGDVVIIGWYETAILSSNNPGRFDVGWEWVRPAENGRSRSDGKRGRDDGFD